jgi:hypothetical protein
VTQDPLSFLVQRERRFVERPRPLAVRDFEVLRLSTPSSPLGSSCLSCGFACGLTCGPASRGGRPSATNGTLRLCPPGRCLSSAGGRSSPRGGGFLRGRTLSTPSGLCCCARHGLSNAGCRARQAFCDSVHARLGGIGYRPQNAFFFLLIHAVHSLRVKSRERHTESKQGSIAKTAKLWTTSFVALWNTRILPLLSGKRNLEDRPW